MFHGGLGDARRAVARMGADPVNQTVKAVAIARTFLERDRMDVGRADVGFTAIMQKKCTTEKGIILVFTGLMKLT